MQQIITKLVVASNDNPVNRAKFNVISNVYRWIRISGITSTLEALDDRTLSDIGIHRNDIRSIAKNLVDNENQPAA